MIRMIWYKGFQILFAPLMSPLEDLGLMSNLSQEEFDAELSEWWSNRGCGPYE